LARGKERRVPRLVSIPAEVAMAFVHGGMWAAEELGGVFCERDRNIVTGIVSFLMLLVLGAASFGVALWLSGPVR